jgi:hypothetical protein
LRNILGVCLGCVGKIARGDEYSFVCLLPCQRANEALDFLPPDCVLPTLRLDIHDIKPKTILVDDAVYTFVI